MAHTFVFFSICGPRDKKFGHPWSRSRQLYSHPLHHFPPCFPAGLNERICICPSSDPEHHYSIAGNNYCKKSFSLNIYILMMTEYSWNNILMILISWFIRCTWFAIVFPQLAQRDQDQECGRSTWRGGLLLCTVREDTASVSLCDEGEPPIYGKYKTLNHGI